MIQYKEQITAMLRRSAKSPMSLKKLFCGLKGKKPSKVEFNRAIKELKNEGVIFERRSGFILCESFGLVTGTVTRLSKTFGFAKLEDGTEVFIPGKFFKGAMPNDVVLLKDLGGSGESPECEVVKVLQENYSRFIGTVVDEDGEIRILPDSFTRNSIAMVDDGQCEFAVGDKVMAEIAVRGERHSEHTARIIMTFGRSSLAKSCTQAVLELNGITPEFPNAVLDDAKAIEHAGISDKEISKRLDLRDECIFTIDGADTKDIDDAISVERTRNGYRLGVHIADVSHYVKAFSPLDKEAMARGTSIYYANSVIPMLPKELSNGICSLNPNTDRLAFSCFMEISGDGELVSYKFSKAVIRSRVQGVYSEVNAILDGSASAEIQEKYVAVQDTLVIMAELAEILTANKIKRGAPQIDTPESKLILDEDGVCVDVRRRERGRSELIIEEFMLMANTAAARFAGEREIPFVYRVHESPSEEKIEELKEIMLRMGVTVPPMKKVKPKHLAMILENAKGSPAYPVINTLVLRSMAKAKYSDEPLGHFGLVLDDYSHFTSPIRRYSDLAIHRIMSEIVENKAAPANVTKRFSGFARSAAERASETELTAMRIERDCDDCYTAEYMRSRLGDEFEGMICSMAEYGFYVELDNTVDGLVHADSLTKGEYVYDGVMSSYRTDSKTYKIGDRIEVVCIKADISSGNVDFTVKT